MILDGSFVRVRPYLLLVIPYLLFFVIFELELLVADGLFERLLVNTAVDNFVVAVFAVLWFDLGFAHYRLLLFLLLRFLCLNPLLYFLLVYLLVALPD